MNIDFKFKRINKDYFIWWIEDIIIDFGTLVEYSNKFSALYENNIVINIEEGAFNYFIDEGDFNKNSYNLTLKILQGEDDLDTLEERDFYNLYKFMVFVNNYNVHKFSNKRDFEIFFNENYAINIYEPISEQSKEDDMVKKPSHYQLKLNGRDIQVRDITGAFIKNFTGNEIVGVYLWNSLKYIFRCDKKENIKQDLSKAKQYIDFALEELENE